MGADGVVCSVCGQPPHLIDDPVCRAAQRLAEPLVPLIAEYRGAMAEARQHAADIIWQSMRHGPDGAPDWLCDEATRPSGLWYFARGVGDTHQVMLTNPRQWRDGGQA